MMLTSTLKLLLYGSLAAAQAREQQPLQPDTAKASSIDLIYELKKAEIIPTVIDTFTPLLTINATWPNATAAYGNTINPSKVQDSPNTTVTDRHASALWPAYKDHGAQIVIALTDPDAPSRENPEWSEICHWIFTAIGGKGVKEIMPYKPPGPPPKTGKHRYVFVVLAPLNGTSEELDLVKPGDRQHWGFEDERQGLRMWAEGMGLGVVGANFIYSQNDDQ